MVIAWINKIAANKNSLVLTVGHANDKKDIKNQLFSTLRVF